MATYKIQNSNNHKEMMELSPEAKQTIAKRNVSCGVMLNKDLLQKMKRYAGIRNEVANNTILYAFIKKLIADGTI